MLTITKGTETQGFKSWDFPDGSLGVRLDIENLRYQHLFTGHQTITARIQNSRDIMELIMVTDALRRWDDTPVHLVLPCLPYARQDRVCCKGEAHSLRAFAAVINGLRFGRVTTFDPHSDVAAGVFDNLTIVDQATIIGRFDALNKRLLPTNPSDAPVFCSPDAGANKKVAALAALYGHTEFVRADKLRDLATGRIKETVVYGEAMVGRDVIIVDDLLDRGGSFIPLAKALMAKGARTVELYVTHGLFTAPLATLLPPLYEAGISRIWTTNTYRTDLLADALVGFSVLDIGQGGFGI